GTVRFTFSDAHGVVRGKTLIAADAIGALRSGVTCTLTMLLKDLSGRTAFPVFQRGGNGASDMVMVADPTTFRVLPWSPHSHWRSSSDRVRSRSHSALPPACNRPI